MGQPDITCVIPAFNDRSHLPRAVKSALDQQGVSVEVRIVDDCSDGPTREAIERLAKTDERIKPFFLSRNGGQSQARNIGGVLATGRFLAFLDQDDEHAPGWYAHAVECLHRETSLGALSGRARMVDIPARFGIDETDLRLRGLSLVFVTNIVFRTSVFRASGGFPTGSVWRTKAAGEDGAYRHSVAQNWSAAQVDVDAVLHRVRDGGATSYFLDRTEVRDGRVVMTRFEPIETDGTLETAQHDYWQRQAQAAAEVLACVRKP